MSTVERVTDQWWESVTRTESYTRSEEIRLIAYTHSARGPQVVLWLNGCEWGNATEGEGVYPEFSPEAARTLALKLNAAANAADAEAAR
jgi:hypothetical protein